MFKQKRHAHHDAIKRILNIKEGNKQKEMLILMLNKMFETMSESMKKLIKAQSESNDQKRVKLNENLANG
jgi:hypothetical protein